jgi:transposase
MVGDPDEVVVHRVRRCSGCGSSLRGTAVQDYDRRQVFELPEIKVRVTEHRAEKKLCGCCGQLSCASFPEGVTQNAQYGSRLQACAVYIRTYGLLSYERAAQLFEDLFAVPLSQGTLVNMDRGCGQRLESAYEQIRQATIKSAVVGFDETGMSVNGTLYWLHTASTEQLTYLACHAKRGTEAFEAIGILPNFTGQALHDHWGSYFNYECGHALCNAHHLRELTFVFEEYGQQWATSMIDLLREIKQAVQRAVQQSRGRFNRPTYHRYEKRYRAILAAGLRANPPPPEIDQSKRGRPKQSKARNLVLRLMNRQSEVLAFMYDFAVPFTNNHAERDLRVSKVQQKISGTFRSAGSAASFCRIRSYIATIKKNGIRVIDALQSVFTGTPLLPSCVPNS